MRGIFLNIFKSCEKAWHKSVTLKLNLYGVESELLSLLKNYAQNCEKRVVSKIWIKKINSEVPQGSVLRPLLFLIYINVLGDGINSMCKTFANDTFLFSKVLEINKSVTERNADLENISQWAHQ